MVRFIRSADVAGGRLMQALSWGKETTAALSKRHGFPEVQVYVQLFSGGGTIYWSSDHESLATLGERNTKIMGDTAYWAAVKNAIDAQFFIEGSVKDVVLQLT